MPNRKNLIKDPVRYKTILCDKWSLNGSCPYGVKCQFAHGESELRERLDKPRKEQKCEPCAETPTGAASARAIDHVKTLPAPAPAVAAARPQPSLPPAPAALQPSPSPTAPQQHAVLSVTYAKGPDGTRGFAAGRGRSLPTPTAVAPALRTPPPPALAVDTPLRSLPPGLGVKPRKSVSFALVAPLSGLTAMPSTPPKVAALLADGWAASENKPPQHQTDEPQTPERPPPVRKIDSGVQPKLGINSVTGKVELALGRQPSYATSAVRRQLSALFADDDDEFADMGSGLDAIDMAGWQHNHFGAPLTAEPAL